MSYKCPYCGRQDLLQDSSFRLHVSGVHGKRLSGDINRFKAPIYGLGSTSDIYERHAREERNRSSWTDTSSDFVNYALAAAVDSISHDTWSGGSGDSISHDTWSGGGGDSGGGGSSGDW